MGRPSRICLRIHADPDEVLARHAAVLRDVLEQRPVLRVPGREALHARSEVPHARVVGLPPRGRDCGHAPGE